MAKVKTKTAAKKKKAKFPAPVRVGPNSYDFEVDAHLDEDDSEMYAIVTINDHEIILTKAQALIFSKYLAELSEAM